MNARGALTDIAVGAAGGVVAVKVMSPVTTKLYELQSDESKKREQDASYGVAYNVAARETANVVGIELSEEQVSKAGMAMHYGLGLTWAPIYMWLRRSRGMSPLRAGMASGVSMYLLVDELLNPVFRFTPPPQAYPLATHVRGLLGHIVYGLGLAGVVEAGWRLLRRRP